MTVLKRTCKACGRTFKTGALWFEHRKATNITANPCRDDAALRERGMIRRGGVWQRGAAFLAAHTGSGKP
jgi:hypothetical protein